VQEIAGSGADPRVVQLRGFLLRRHGEC
jgi:hypothetical protein